MNNAQPRFNADRHPTWGLAKKQKAWTSTRALLTFRAKERVAPETVAYANTKTRVLTAVTTSAATTYATRSHRGRIWDRLANSVTPQHHDDGADADHHRTPQSPREQKSSRGQSMRQAVGLLRESTEAKSPVAGQTSAGGHGVDSPRSPGGHQQQGRSPPPGGSSGSPRTLFVAAVDAAATAAAQHSGPRASSPHGAAQQFSPHSPQGAHSPTGSPRGGFQGAMLGSPRGFASNQQPTQPPLGNLNLQSPQAPYAERAAQDPRSPTQQAPKKALPEAIVPVDAADAATLADVAKLAGASIEKVLLARVVLKLQKAREKHVALDMASLHRTIARLKSRKKKALRADGKYTRNVMKEHLERFENEGFKKGIVANAVSGWQTVRKAKAERVQSRRREMLEKDQLIREQAWATKFGEEAKEAGAEEGLQAHWFRLIALCSRTGDLVNAVADDHANTDMTRFQRTCARLIQRKWTKTREQEKGRKYRKAIAVVRRMTLHKVVQRLQLKKSDAADKVVNFLGQYDNTNFIKVMRNYRFKVIRCQRFWRTFCAITRARCRLLMLKWERVEGEYWKREKERMHARNRKRSMFVDNASRGASNAHETGQHARHQELNLETQLRHKMQLLAQMSNSPKAHAHNHIKVKMDAAVVSKEVIRVRVARSEKTAILVRLLHDRRMHFRNQLLEKKRMLVVQQRESQMLNIADARTMMKMDKEVSTDFITDKVSVDTGAAMLNAVFLMLSSINRRTWMHTVEKAILAKADRDNKVTSPTAEGAASFMGSFSGGGHKDASNVLANLAGAVGTHSLARRIMSSGLAAGLGSRSGSGSGSGSADKSGDKANQRRKSRLVHKKEVSVTTGSPSRGRRKSRMPG